MHAACITRFGSSLVLAVLLGPISPALAAGVKLPGGETVEKVDFERHVMGVFGRHGLQFRLLPRLVPGQRRFPPFAVRLRSGDGLSRPQPRHQGRRLNQADPDNSLLLLKAVGQVPHDGQTRFGRDSWAYQLLRAWIVQGARWNKGSGIVRKLTISPPEYVFSKPGQRGQLQVHATFADGTTEAITSLCEFRTSDEAVVEAMAVGGIRAMRPAIPPSSSPIAATCCRCASWCRSRRKPGFQYPNVPEVNFIDREVFAKLRGSTSCRPICPATVSFYAA